MQIVLEVDQTANFLSSLEITSNLFPEIMNSGHKRDLSQVIDESNLNLFKKLNATDFLKSALSKNFDRKILIDQIDSSYVTHFQTIEPGLNFFKNKASSQLLQIKDSILKIIPGANFLLTISLVDAPVIGYNVYANEILFSPRKPSEPPFYLAILNGAIYIHLFNNFAKELQSFGVDFDRLSIIANHLIVKNDLWEESIRKSIDGNPNHQGSPIFILDQNELDFLNKVGL